MGEAKGAVGSTGKMARRSRRAMDEVNIKSVFEGIYHRQPMSEKERKGRRLRGTGVRDENEAMLGF